MPLLLTLLLLLLGLVTTSAQTGSAQTETATAPDPPTRTWHSIWVTHPTAPMRDPVVLHFRRDLNLDRAPSTYRVRVSADNHFTLYVNGTRAGDGPARGDLARWRYEIVDLAPMLHPGKNLITATVWNFGVYAPTAQMSNRTAFLLESEATGATGISTPEHWLVEQEPGHRPLPRKPGDFWEQMLSGPGEELDAAHFDWQWNTPTANGGNWVPVTPAMREWMSPAASAAKSSTVDRDNPWGLIPDTLPPMEYTPTPAGEVVRIDNSQSEARTSAKHNAQLRAFPAAPVAVPAHTHVHLLLDRRELTTAYPALTVSGGRGSRVRLVYAEALYDREHHKGDRDAIDGRTAAGMTDSFLPDGAANRTFQPLWWRTWRFLDLDVQTAADPLTLVSLQASFTAYPFQQRASFHSGNTDLDRIWQISWRTAHTGAHDVFTDSPYYEQLQYVGDSRIESLLSYAITGDDRLARQAIQAFDDSRIPEGLTQSRYPSAEPQVIPTFSLLWIGMVHDFWQYRPDPEQVRRWLPGTRSVLAWFSTHQQPDGLLDRLPWWSFVDWVPTGEIPTYDAHGESCTTTLEYLGALNDAADLEGTLGDTALATQYQQRAATVREGLRTQCWDDTRGLLADSPGKEIFSQQTNILAVLYDVIPKEQQQPVLTKLLAIQPGDIPPSGLLSASYYFRFYLARAMEHAGMADGYLASLDPWRKLLPMHFSTWPEVPGNTRSDSHAWTAHPIYDLMTLVAGIEPGSPGFATVRIEPHLGPLPALDATYPHPAGTIHVVYQATNGGLAAQVTLPGSLTGVFVFHGKSWPLTPGTNTITAK